MIPDRPSDAIVTTMPRDSRWRAVRRARRSWSSTITTEIDSSLVVMGSSERAAKPAFLHIGLGDTDELGHRDDYPGYLVALRNADALIGSIADEIAKLGALGEKTTLLVTPDHGRNSDFRDHGTLRIESGRTFLLAFGAGVTARGIGCPPRDITLADIAPTIRVRLGLPRDVGDGAGKRIDLRAPGTEAL